MTLQATHPAFSNTATWLFLLPLPLSRIAPAGVEAALATLPPALAAPFARGVRWTEADDEPHSGLGMGARRAKDLMTSADLGGMYM
jgi:hypothetical protein